MEVAYGEYDKNIMMSSAEREEELALKADLKKQRHELEVHKTQSLKQRELYIQQLVESSNKQAEAHKRELQEMEA